MKLSLKLIYLLNPCLDSDQTSIASGNLNSLLCIGDLGPVLKVIRQLTKVDFIAKNEIFLEQMGGYSSDLSGYIIVTGLRHVSKFW